MSETKKTEAESMADVENLEDEIFAEVFDEEILDPVEVELAEVRAERDDLKDKLMRALAEAENTRRRAERDRKDAEAYGGTKLARDVLSVHDNLERALAATDDEVREQAASLIEGVELTQKDLLTAFAKHKIMMVNPEAGEKFDPNMHQAMFEAPIPGAEPGTIIEVMQAGFSISGRLLRPALVGVARAMPEA
jgi:molecular chaperone GrpE